MSLGTGGGTHKSLTSQARPVRVLRAPLCCWSCAGDRGVGRGAPTPRAGEGPSAEPGPPGDRPCFLPQHLRSAVPARRRPWGLRPSQGVTDWQKRIQGGHGSRPRGRGLVWEEVHTTRLPGARGSFTRGQGPGGAVCKTVPPAWVSAGLSARPAAAGLPLPAPPSQPHFTDREVEARAALAPPGQGCPTCCSQPPPFQPERSACPSPGSPGVSA